jgi:hypothetical protein
MQNRRATTAILIGTAAGATILIAGAIAVTPRSAMANPTIAQKTGFACTKCHTAPPTLNAYGQSYKKKMKK